MAVATPNSSPELEDILKELQTALSEHTRRMRKLPMEIAPNRREL